jgi:hypothetical protein
MFLQRPTKVGELFGLGTRDVCLGVEVPLDGIGTGMTNVTFCVHLPESTRKGCQAFLPCDDGTLSVIQLPFLGKELLLQLDDHCMRRRRSPTPIHKQKPASRQRSKPRRAPTWSKDSPGRW